MAMYKAFPSVDDRYTWICDSIRHRREATESEGLAQTNKIVRLARKAMAGDALDMDRAYYMHAPGQCWGVEEAYCRTSYPSDDNDIGYHHDGSITFWDVNTRGWVRTSCPSDQLLASLDDQGRERIKRHIAKHKERPQ